MSDSNTQRAVLGKVISTKSDKTIVVSVERRVKHALYGKYIRRSSKIIAHDEGNTCNEGDLVEIVETKPISKRKSWSLKSVLQEVGGVEAAG